MTNSTVDEIENDAQFWGLFSIVYNSWNRGYTMTGMSLSGKPLTVQEAAYVIADVRQWAHRIASIVRGMAHVLAADHPPLKDRAERIVADVDSLADDYRLLMGFDALEKIERRIGNE